jgi:outer membrane protein
MKRLGSRIGTAIGAVSKKCVLLCVALGFASQAFPQALTLEQVIREACAKSDSVKMMKQTIIKADQVVRQNWSAALPKASSTLYGGHAYGSLTSGSMGGGSSMGGSSGGLGKAAAVTPADYPTIAGIAGSVVGEAMSQLMAPTDMEIYSASVSVTQPIYTFGKVGTAVDVASQFSKSARASYRRNLQQIQMMALDVFYRTLLAQMAAGISEHSLSRKQDLCAFLDGNFKLGSGSKAQLLAAIADASTQKADLITARQNVRSAKMNLNSFIGRPITDDFELDTSAAVPISVKEGIPAESDAVGAALKNRGDMESIEYFKKANIGGAKLYRAMYLPNIAATGSLGISGRALEDMIDWDNHNWSLGVAMQWSFFDGFANSAKAAQYQSDADKLAILQNSLTKMLEIEVRAAVQECAAADTNIVASQDAYAAAKESYELMNGNFKQGSGQLTDLQQSEERLRQAEMGLINARYRLTKSRAALQVAMGNDIVKLEDR